MDFLNRAYGHLVELFRSMSPAARVTTGLLLAVVITSLAFLFQHQTDHTNEYLFGGEHLTQSDIAALEMAFGKAGLNGWTTEGDRIRVPRSQKHSYLAAAAKESAIPETFRNSSDEMLAKNSPFDPKDVRIIRERNAKEKFLSETIRAMSGIERVRVSLDETTLDGFPPKKQRRAMVAVEAYGSKHLNSEQVNTIRYTVAGGAGLDASEVTVTDLNSGLVYPGVGKGSGPSEFENIAASYQRQYEGHYKQLISEALSMIPGVTVAVHVELDKEMNTETRSFKYDDKPTGVETKTETRETSTSADRTAGRPGPASNGVQANASTQVATTAGGESTSTENRENQKSVVGATEVKSQKAGLVPTHVTATIGVPTSYFVKIWRQQHPAAQGGTDKDPPANELQDIERTTKAEIEQSVANLLPRTTTGDSTLQLVRVMPYTEMPQQPPLEPGMSEIATSWFADNWQTVGLFGLAALGVLFLRGMIRSAHASAAVSAAAHPHDAGATNAGTESFAETDEVDVTDAASALKRKFQSSGRSLRDELSDLVKGDPDAAASIVKLWISDAA